MKIKRQCLAFLVSFILLAMPCFVVVCDAAIIEVQYNQNDDVDRTTYVCWVQDLNGNIIQNLYICNRIGPVNPSLLGIPLPYWNHRKNRGKVDGVSGASIQTSLTISRELSVTARKFRVYFEIDRSRNGNNYFRDRPAIIYATDIIDLDQLKAVYEMQVVGWMSNDTTSGTYSQKPNNISSVSGWEPFKLFDDLSYVQPIPDMVDTITVKLN